MPRMLGVSIPERDWHMPTFFKSVHPFRVGDIVSHHAGTDSKYRVTSVYNYGSLSMFDGMQDGKLYREMCADYYELVDRVKIPKPNCGQFALSEWS